MRLAARPLWLPLWLDDLIIHIGQTSQNKKGNVRSGALRTQSYHLLVPPSFRNEASPVPQRSRLVRNEASPVPQNGQADLSATKQRIWHTRGCHSQLLCNWSHHMWTSSEVYTRPWVCTISLLLYTHKLCTQRFTSEDEFVRRMRNCIIGWDCTQDPVISIL